MTIKEAARTILSDAAGPLTALEISRRITEKQLFVFKVANPRSVVLATLKRHSINSHSCSPSKHPCFRQVDNMYFEPTKSGKPQTATCP
jgi:hypothetical protein